MIPNNRLLSHTVHRFLHVCGGDPEFENGLTDDMAVFSTYVEVILMPY